MTKWRDVLTIHPAALAFPRLSDAELRDLAADIKVNGLKVPVVVMNNKADKMILLDGISRLDALEMNGVELINKKGKLHMDYRDTSPLKGKRHTIYQLIKPKDKAETIALIRSLNEHRRHLTVKNRQQTRERIEALLKAHPTKSNRQIGKLVGKHHTTIGTVRQNLEQKGDVAKLATSTDTKGRKQPRRRSKPEPEVAPADQRGAGEPAPLVDARGVPMGPAWAEPSDEPSSTSDTKRGRHSSEVLKEEADKSANFIRIVISNVFNDEYENSDAILECLLTNYIDELVEFVRHPKFARIVAAVAAKLGSEVGQATDTEPVSSLIEGTDQELKIKFIGLQSENEELRARITELEKSSAAGDADAVSRMSS